MVTLNQSVRIAPKIHLNDLDQCFCHSSDLVTPDGGVNNVISKVKKKKQLMSIPLPPKPILGLELGLDAMM